MWCDCAGISPCWLLYRGKQRRSVPAAMIPVPFASRSALPPKMPLLRLVLENLWIGRMGSEEHGPLSALFLEVRCDQVEGEDGAPRFARRGVALFVCHFRRHPACVLDHWCERWGGSDVCVAFHCCRERRNERSVDGSPWATLCLLRDVSGCLTRYALMRLGHRRSRCPRYRRFRAALPFYPTPMKVSPFMAEGFGACLHLPQRRMGIKSSFVREACFGQVRGTVVGL